MESEEETTKGGGGPPPSTPAQLRDFVRRFDRVSFLAAIAEVSSHEGKKDRLARYFPRVLNAWGLGDLAVYVIRYGSTFRRAEAGQDEVIQGMNLVNGLGTEMGAKDESGDLTDVRDAWRFLYRLGIKQFPDQYSITQQFGRMLVLYDELPRTVPRLARYDMAARFQAVTGVTLEQYIWCAFGLYISATRSDPIFDLEWMAKHEIASLRGIINEDTIRATMAIMSAPIAEIKALADAEDPGVKDKMRATFVFNPLVSSPIVRLPGTRERYVAPVWKYILRRVIDGPYYLLLDADHEVFTTYFGEVFEEYVGWLLRPTCATTLRPEFEYGPKKVKAKSPDWLLDESDGVPLLECKSGRLRKDLKTIASHEEVRDGFAAIYGQAARQLENFQQAIPREADLAWLRGRALHPLVVLLDPIYLSNSVLWEGERSFAKTKYGVSPEFSPEVMSVQALEHLAPMLDKRTLSDWIRAKARDPQAREWDWEQYVDDNGGEINARLEQRWNSFFDSKAPDGDFAS